MNYKSLLKKTHTVVICAVTALGLLISVAYAMTPSKIESEEELMKGLSSVADQYRAELFDVTTQIYDLNIEKNRLEDLIQGAKDKYHYHEGKRDTLMGLAQGT